MNKHIKIIMGVTMCISMVSCSHICKTNFTSGQKYHYGENDFLNYRTKGKGEQTLIFLHGFAASNQTWDDILPFLSGFNGRIIMFDLKGYGFSSKRKGNDYSIIANAEVISKFIESNEIEDYVIAGHSFGGGVALMTTLKQLENSKLKPKGLILIDSAAYKVKLPFFVSYLRTPILGYALLNFASPEYQAEYTLKKLYYDKGKVTDEKIARYAYFMEKEGHNNTMLECAKHIVPENVEYYTSRYKNIDIPALVIWGKNDTALPVSSAYKLSEELQDSKLVIIDKCGHIPQEEYPRQTAEEINRFLKSI